MPAVLEGRMGWSVRRDEEGHRYYDLISLVRNLTVIEGPYNALSASGLPTVGSTWSFGSDYDPWAYCWPTAEATPHFIENEPNVFWQVKQTFSTKPFRRCQDMQIENPLAEPAKISGSFVKKSKLIETDRHDKPILSSSHELTLGVEKDCSSPAVVIEYNVATLDLDDLCTIIDTLNDAELWGFEKRCVKLSNITWARNVYGVCAFYYTRRFEFDIDKETFDETKIIDRGFKHFDTRRHGNEVGTGDSLRDDPKNFVVYRDKNGEPSPEPVLLNNYGDVVEDVNAPFSYRPKVEKYEETNFLLYGIPSVLT